MTKPIEISNGWDTIKIYTGTRGKSYYQLSFYMAGLRERRTFLDKQKAKREAKVILGQLASLTGAVNDEMAGAVRQLGMPADPFVALHEAVAFYLKHHPVGFNRLTLGKIMQAYVDSRRRIGLSKGRVGAVESIFRVMSKRFRRQRRACLLGKRWWPGWRRCITIRGRRTRI